MDEENKQYNEKIKESAGKLSEAAKEKAKKEVVKKIITVLGAKGVAILILVVIGITWLTTVFLAAAIQWNDLVTKIKATAAKTKAIGEEPLDTILTIENGKYKIKYKNKDGKEVTGKEAIKAILEDNDINFEDFSDEETECLYKCLKAEWATTYPNLGKDVDNTDIDSEDVQGVITIKRGKTDGNIINLTYKPYEDFTNIKDESALNYFSIKDGNIIVANWSSSEIIYTPSESMPAEIKSQYVNTGEQINITETAINYKSMIGIHTIPFELLLSLLINTEEVEFASELADLAFESTIEMTVYDNTTEIITIETEHTNEKTTYEKWVDYYIKTTTTEFTEGGTVGHTSSFNSATVKNEKINPVTEKKEVDYSLTTKTITKDNSYVVGLTNVSSWIGDIKNEYTYKSIVGPEEDLGLGTPNTYTETGEIESISVNDSDVQVFKNSKYSKNSRVDSYNNSTHITEQNCIIEAARKQGTLNGLYELTKNTSQTNEYRYESGTKQTTNIGKKFKEVYDKHPKAKAQLDCVSSWLFEMLEETESTVDYVSVMKYLLYVCTGVDYGVTEDDIIQLLDTYQEIGSFSLNGENGVGTGWWWPIGSEQTEIIDGKIFAKGEPALGKNNVSRAGKSTSRYNGYYGTHEKSPGAAVDIAGNGKTNTWNVISIGNGTVLRCADGIRDGVKNDGRYGAGNYVVIGYGNGVEAYYYHLYSGSITVKKGDTVKYGQVIAKMGNSGNSTGVHLHIEIKVNDVIVDTTEYINPDEPRAVETTVSSLKDWLWNIEGGSEYINGNIWTVFDPAGSDNTMNLAHGMVIASYDGRRFLVS